MRALANMYRTGAPGRLHMTAEDVIAEGDQVAVR